MSTGKKNHQAEHRLHFAAHQGYQLENSYAFLKKYGAQILSLLQMFRYSIEVPGYTTPSMECLANEPEIIHSPALSGGIELAIYRSIEFIDRLLQNTRSNPYSQLDSNTVDSTTSYFDPEYEKILEYLKLGDERLSTSTKSIAGLYRIITPEGNVKWVCHDHYKPFIRPTISSNLRGCVGNTYNSMKGSISISLKNHSVASTVFSELGKTKSIIELSINLEWSVNPKELKALVASLEQNTSIVSITLNCNKLNSTINFLGRNNKINPVLQLLSLSRLRSFSLGEMDGFLARASTTSWFSLTHSLDLTGIMDWRQQHTQLSVVFRNCPKLMELGLHCTNLEDAFTTVHEALKILDPSQQYQFQRLKLSSNVGEKAQVDYHRTQVAAIDLVVHANKFPYHFLALNAIRKITFMGLIDSTCSPDQQMLENIAKTQPHLAELNINCLPNLFRPTYELIRNLSLIEREKFAPIQSMVLTFQSNTLIVNDINDPSTMALILKGHLSLEPKAVVTLLREFGCALVDWEIHNNAMYTFPSAAIIGIDVPLKENHNMNGGGNLKLERLHITASNLEPNDLHKLSSMILENCPRLEEFCIDFRDNFRIDVMFQYAWGEWISTVSSKVTSILIHGDAIRELRFLERTCLLEFPKMKKFWITLPAFRQIEPITYLHLIKQLEMFYAIPGTKAILPSYSLTNPTTPEDFPIAIPVSYSKTLSRSSLEFYDTNIGSSCSLDLSDQSIPLFRQWPGPKMSPELTNIGLEYIGISKAGWAKLIYMIDMLSLEELSFKGSNITDEVVRIIQGRLVFERDSVASTVPRNNTDSSRETATVPVAKLKWLNLQNCNQISTNGRNDLYPWMKKHLPGCTLLI
ncbi:hypothetical protein BGZ76_001029 [Entomortierella beljakovae]|nr:hypothetical protein BGZ76_001029 [Entomortierella beljakovae]